MGVESPEPARTPTGAVFLSYASQDAEPARKIATPCAQLESKSGSTRASFAAGMPGIARFASRSTIAPSSYRSSPPTLTLVMRATSAASGGWRSNALVTCPSA